MKMHDKTIVAVVIVVLAIGASYLILNYENKSDFRDYDVVYPNDLPGFHINNNTPGSKDDYEPSSQPVIPEDTSSYAEFYSQEQDGVEWLEHPELVGPLDVFSEDVLWDLNQRLFYRIGYDNGGDILVTSVPCDGICGDSLVFFVKKDLKYYLLANYSGPIYIPDGGESPRDAVARGVGIDTTTQYRALSYPNELIMNGEYFQKSKGFGGEIFFFANVKDGFDRYPDITQLQLEAVTEYGPLYSFGTEIQDTPSRLTDYQLRLQGGLTVRYDPSFEFIGDDGVPQVTWSDGTQNTRPYKTNSVGGCGSSATEVVRGEDIAQGDIEEIGFTANGKPIYGITRTDHFLVEKLFKASGGRYYVYNEEAKQGESKTFTKLDILNDRLLFLYKDGFGDYVVFSSTQHAPAAECAKPVIYLYPEKTTEVSVEVGAQVTRSEPAYGNGWSVVAHPDGVLEHEGKKYSSLFWDGIGYGEYPFPKTGFVVSGDEVEEVLREHLTAFGLNQVEQEDFLEFWLPHMPKTPYVRLSWITTEDMNRLAPLHVVPRPDTVFRIFLDFEGLDSYVNIPPQDIVPIERDGFTLVEWGGLLVK